MRILRRLGRHRLVAATLLFCIPATPAHAKQRIDLRMFQTGYTYPAVEGEPIVYGLQVNNPGSVRGTKIKTRTVIPPGAVFLSADPGCKYSDPSRTITCRYGALPPGGSATHSFALIPTSHGELALVSNLLSEERDAWLPDNHVITRIQVQGRPYDFAAVPVSTAFECVSSPDDCELRTPVTLLESGLPYIQADLEFDSYRYVDWNYIHYSLSGSLGVTVAKPPLAAVHQITLYVSSDAVVDAQDIAVWTSSSTGLGTSVGKKKPIVFRYDAPSQLDYGGQFLLLALDSTDSISETDEANNVLFLGVLP